MQHVQDGREEGAAMKRPAMWILASSVLLVLPVLAKLAIMEIPPLPVGWELTIIPGFDPCIELALEDTYDAHFEGKTTEQMKAHMAHWGEAAIPELIRLYEDPRWHEYRRTIAGYLGAMPTEESRTWASGYAHALLKKAVWTEEDCGAFRMLVIPFGKDFDDAVFNLALERLPEFAAAVDVTAERKVPAPFDEVCRLFECTGREGLAEVLEPLTVVGEEHTRETCIMRLVYHRPARAVLEALRLGDRTRDPGRRARLSSLLSYRGGLIRAQEPMRHVLETEE